MAIPSSCLCIGPTSRYCGPRLFHVVLVKTDITVRDHLVAHVSGAIAPDR